jgi:mRNA-degrading endonuclease toxin of MazEF toxin-antitoxin module
MHNKSVSFTPSTLNVVLKSVFDLSNNLEVDDEFLDYLLVKQLDNISFLASSDNPELIPHLFYFSAGLVRTEQQLAVSLRLAARVSRHYKEFRAIAIPLVVEGLAILSTKFPHPDSQTGLTKESCIDCFQIRCLAEGRILKKLGEIQQITLDATLARVGAILSIGEEHIT